MHMIDDGAFVADCVWRRFLRSRFPVDGRRLGWEQSERDELSTAGLV